LEERQSIFWKKTKKERKKGKIIEDEIYQQLSLNNFQFEPELFFAYEFYPCSVFRNNAKRIGTEMKEKFIKEDERLVKAFGLIEWLNSERILHPELHSDGLISPRKHCDTDILSPFY
jgi:hypothetical protein